MDLMFLPEDELIADPSTLTALQAERITNFWTERKASGEEVFRFSNYIHSDQFLPAIYPQLLVQKTEDGGHVLVGNKKKRGKKASSKVKVDRKGKGKAKAEDENEGDDEGEGQEDLEEDEEDVEGKKEEEEEMNLIGEQSETFDMNVSSSEEESGDEESSSEESSGEEEEDPPQITRRQKPMLGDSTDAEGEDYDEDDVDLRIAQIEEEVVPSSIAFDSPASAGNSLSDRVDFLKSLCGTSAYQVLVEYYSLLSVSPFHSWIEF